MALHGDPASTGKIQLEAKDDIRTRLGRSPDRADAVTMAFAVDMSRAPLAAMRLVPL